MIKRCRELFETSLDPMVLVVFIMNEVLKKNDTQHPFRILLVEDNPGDVKLISVVISLMGVPNRPNRRQRWG